MIMRVSLCWASLPESTKTCGEGTKISTMRSISSPERNSYDQFLIFFESLLHGLDLAEDYGADGFEGGCECSWPWRGLLGRLAFDGVQHAVLSAVSSA